MNISVTASCESRNSCLYQDQFVQVVPSAQFAMPVTGTLLLAMFASEIPSQPSHTGIMDTTSMCHGRAGAPRRPLKVGTSLRRRPLQLGRAVPSAAISFVSVRARRTPPFSKPRLMASFFPDFKGLFSPQNAYKMRTFCIRFKGSTFATLSASATSKFRLRKRMHFVHTFTASLPIISPLRLCAFASLRWIRKPGQNPAIPCQNSGVDHQNL